MPGKKAIPVAIAFTLCAGLAMPAMAQQTRDREQTTQQQKQEQRTEEMKGPVADAVNHLKDAYSELAKSHASLIAGKWDDAQKSIDAAKNKLDDALEVRNLPNDVKIMIGGMKKRLADLDASIARRDNQQQAAHTANRTVRDMGQNMNHILASHGPAAGGGGGPQDKSKMQRRGGGGGAQDLEEDRIEQEQMKQEQMKKEQTKQEQMKQEQRPEQKREQKQERKQEEESRPNR